MFTELQGALSGGGKAKTETKYPKAFPEDGEGKAHNKLQLCVSEYRGWRSDLSSLWYFEHKKAIRGVYHVAGAYSGGVFMLYVLS